MATHHYMRDWSIEDDVLLDQTQRLTEPKTSITHQRYCPSGFIVHFKATLLDCCNNLCGHAWTLVGVTIDFNFMDDHDLISGDPEKCKNA